MGSGSGVSLQTIFEINASSRDLSSQVMRCREKDRKAIASFQQGRQENREGPGAGSGLGASGPQEEEQPEKEEVSVEVQALPWGPWSLAWGGGKAKSSPSSPWG